jgi:hypothetical protein
MMKATKNDTPSIPFVGFGIGFERIERSNTIKKNSNKYYVGGTCEGRKCMKPPMSSVSLMMRKRKKQQLAFWQLFQQCEA